MGALPAGEGVGAEPRVHDTQVGLQLGSGQVRVELPQLARVELALQPNSNSATG